MTPEQTQILNLATSLGVTSESDSTAIAAAVQTANTPSVTVHSPALVSLGTVLAALAQAGHDPNAVIGALEATNTGRLGVQKLSSAGLDFGHPVTQALLQSTVAANGITQGVADLLTGLSVKQITPAEQAGLVPVTAEQITEALTAQQAVIDAETQRVQDAAAAGALDTARMTLWQTWQDIYNQNISPVLDGPEPTVANLDVGIVAALAALRGE